ncbi:MAG: hypothetical protein HUU54_02190 [Ignavibacteriaceae bacterium]|nr:hypothetical protein [Ignavibacteriaceae bacterium]
MIRDVLSTINGIEVYPIIGLILFFLVFTGLLVLIFRMDKNLLTKMSNLPFESDNENKEIKRN